VIFNVNFKTLSSLIKSAFVGVWTLYLKTASCLLNDNRVLKFLSLLFCRK